MSFPKLEERVIVVYPQPTASGAFDPMPEQAFRPRFTAGTGLIPFPAQPVVLQIEHPASTAPNPPNRIVQFAGIGMHQPRSAFAAKQPC
jgi:hypothetical protein